MDQSAWTQSGCLTVVNYHHVRVSPDPDFPHLHGLTLDQFRHQLDTLGRTFELVSPSDVLCVLRGSGSLPKNACLLTFDDGLREHREIVAPELRSRGLKALFFVCTAPYASGILLSVHRAHLLSGRFGYAELADELMETAEALRCPPVDAACDARGGLQYRYDDRETARVKFYLNFVLTPEQRDDVLARVFQARLGDEGPFAQRHYMSRRQVREMATLDMEVGLHSHRHLPLARVPEEEMRADLRRNARWIEALAGRAARWVSYPYGGPDACSERVAAAARSLSLAGGFTMTRQINRLPLRPMAIGRLDTNDAPGGKRPVALERLQCV